MVLCPCPGFLINDWKFLSKPHFNDFKILGTAFQKRNLKRKKIKLTTKNVGSKTIEKKKKKVGRKRECVKKVVV